MATATSKSRERKKETRPKRPARRARKYWSKSVMERSDALDLDEGVFKLRSPRKIAESLKRSAERSRRRKAAPFQSAMSMLNFYINRGGRNLSATRKRILNGAKERLRELFHREARPTTARSAPAKKRNR